MKAMLIEKKLDDMIFANAPSIINDLQKAGLPIDQLIITEERRREGSLTTEFRLEEEKQSLQKLRPVEPSTKELLLAICLRSVSFHKQALAYVEPRLAKIRRNVKPENAVRVNLLSARLFDATSDYVASEKHATEALKETANLLTEKRTFERIALRVQALHAFAMSRKMQMGPVIKYNKRGIDFRPPTRDALRNLVLYLTHLIRMRLLLLTAIFVEPNLKRVRPPTSSDDLYLVEAWYWYLDHKIIFLAFLEGGLTTLNVIRTAVSKTMQLLYRGTQRQAARVGDAFTIANAGKYLTEPTGTKSKPAAEAISIYGLITDKINKALLHRKAGDKCLEEGNINKALEEYNECLRLANESGSYATALKAQVALYVCGLPIPLDDLKLYREHITGEGYKTYIDRLINAVT